MWMNVFDPANSKRVLQVTVSILQVAITVLQVTVMVLPGKAVSVCRILKGIFVR
jgi:hypothetical protein